MPEKMPVQCWRQHRCSKDNDTSTRRTKTSAQGCQRCQCNKGKDTSKTMIFKTQAQLWPIRSRMTPCITFYELSHQLLISLKCPASPPPITWGHCRPPPCPPHLCHPRVLETKKKWRLGLGRILIHQPRKQVPRGQTRNQGQS